MTPTVARSASRLRVWHPRAEAFWPLALAAAAWLTLASFAATGVPLALCLSQGGGSVANFTANLQAQLVWLDPRLLAAEWVLMCVAMMAPLFIPVLHNLSAYSFRRHRQRNIALVSLSYAFVLCVAGVPMICVAILGKTALDGTGLTAAAALLGFGIAALWHANPLRQRALRFCHRSHFPFLSARGVVGYGMAHGWYCCLACLPAMLATMLSGHGVVPMLAVAHLLIQERMAHRPPVHAVRPYLIAFGALLTVSYA